MTNLGKFKNKELDRFWKEKKNKLHKNFGEIKKEI